MKVKAVYLKCFLMKCRRYPLSLSTFICLYKQTVYKELSLKTMANFRAEPSSVTNIIKFHIFKKCFCNEQLFSISPIKCFRIHKKLLRLTEYSMSMTKSNTEYRILTITATATTKT